MNNISFLKKYRIFRKFKKTIDQNKEGLSKKFNLRVDNAYRLYTVLNIPKELIGEEYDLRTNDIEKISETYIREYTKELAEYLKSIGLSEMFSFYETKKLTKYGFLLVYGFSLFNTDKFYNRLYITSGVSIGLLIILSIILFFV